MRPKNGKKNEEQPASTQTLLVFTKKNEFD